MALKMNVLYPFDKAFFGKPMKPFAAKGAKVEKHFDSVSDFCKHMEDCARKIHSGMPKSDTVEIRTTQIEDLLRAIEQTIV